MTQTLHPMPSSLARRFVWLASQSPRRQELLQQIGVDFELLLPDPHEDAEALEAIEPGETPGQYVERVVHAKAMAAQSRLTRRGGADAPILVADTTVALGGTILGKPADGQDAARILGLLAGRSHRVLTAVAVVHRGRIEQALSLSRVRFERLSPQRIADYVASGEPFGKAGAYAIQGRAAAFIRRIEGSHSGIMGLPLHETSRLLQRAGLDPERQA